MMACRASSLTNLLCVTCEFVSVQSAEFLSLFSCSGSEYYLQYNLVC